MAAINRQRLFLRRHSAQNGTLTAVDCVFNNRLWGGSGNIQLRGGAGANGAT